MPPSAMSLRQHSEETDRSEVFWLSRDALANGLGADRPDPGNMLQEVLWDSVPFHKVLWVVVREPDIVGIILPYERF